MRDVPIALEVLSFPLPLRQRFIQSCHLKRSACTFKSCVAFGEEANSLQWLKNLLWSFHVVKLWISWHQHCNFHCSHDSSEKRCYELCSAHGPKEQTSYWQTCICFFFFPSQFALPCCQEQKRQKQLLFHLSFPQGCRWLSALEQSGSREYLRSRVAAVDCRGKSMLPIKPAQPRVHTHVLCFQMLQFALAPFPVVLINLSTVFYQQIFQLHLHINSLRLIHFL